MRPKEKAQELVDRYYSHLTDVLMKSESEEFEPFAFNLTDTNLPIIS